MSWLWCKWLSFSWPFLCLFVPVEQSGAAHPVPPVIQPLPSTVTEKKPDCLHYKACECCLNMNSLFYLNSLFGHLVYCNTSEKGTSCCIEIQWDAHLNRGWLFGESPTALHLYNQILNKRLAIDVTSVENWCFHCCVGELFENWSCSCRIMLKFGLFNETANHFIEL